MTFWQVLWFSVGAANHQSDDNFCQADGELSDPAGADRCSGVKKRFTLPAMTIPTQPNVKLTNDATYRESYANSVQMRVNIWDFFLVFGTLQQQTETQVEIRNFQGIYLSPQQAKALLGLLQQNIATYETAFGEIKLDPRMSSPGPVH
jgi:Protein of unknown function (DUF3467)